MKLTANSPFFRSPAERGLVLSQRDKTHLCQHQRRLHLLWKRS